MSYLITVNKLFRHTDRLDAIRRGTILAPINVEIDLSNRCSLGCKFCHMAYTHVRGPNTGKQLKPDGAIPGGDLMDLALAYKIISDLEDCGVRSITWTGGGEPTLHPDFDRIIDFVQIDQGLYTNGMNIDRKRAELLKNKCKWVYVSLDAIDQPSFKKLKGVDQFTNVCMSIINLTNASGHAIIGVGFLINKDNWKDAWKMADIANKMGANYVQFRPTIIFDPNDPAHLAEDTKWMDIALGYLKELKYKPGLEMDIDRFEAYKNWTKHPYSTCYWSGIQAVITPNGKVWTCVNKREYPGAELGDLSQEPFTEIWKRRKIAQVDKDCRVMCRGNPGNIALNELYRQNDHENFV